MDKVYVVTAPDAVRGVYETWEECRAAISGVSGVKQQAATREQADAILRGEGNVLPEGRYAFTDGSGAGGVGLVLIEQGPDGPRSVREIGRSAREVLGEARIRGLDSPDAIQAALRQHRQIIPEMTALYLALSMTEPESDLVVVHDYQGVAEFIEGTWKSDKPLVSAIVEWCREMITAKGLRVRFRHQDSHVADVLGLDEFIKWNGRADELARSGATD